jgi:S1-C subfamily serine protease
MNDLGSAGDGGSRQASPAVLLTLVLAVALLAGAISGTAVALLNDSDSDSAPAATTVAEEPTPPALPGFAGDAVSAVAARALPSVVAIVNQFEFEGVPSTAGGAGVIVDERGYILTNAHLVQIPGEIFVLMNNGEVRPGQLVSHDAPFTDVAVVRVAEGGLTPLAIGDSAELAPGQTVLAIGSPDIDYYNSITTGVVSAVGRRKQLTNVWFEDLIQTDAAINVGNSGGPLLTLGGEMVGLNTFRDIGADEPLFGISFAISSRIFAPIVQSMIDTGSFARPYLGVDFRDLTPEVAVELNVTEMQGALVQQVTPGSPAEAAGLQAGDVLTMFGQVPLSSQFGLLNALGVTVPNASISVQLLRGGEPLTLDVQLEPR